MKTTCITAFVVFSMSSAALADNVITEWNRALLDSVRATNTAPPAASRMMAMLHVAQFEAVNSVDRNYRSYYGYFDCPQNSSKEAAAACAARDVMVQLFPGRAAAFDAQLQAHLSAIPDGASKTNGIQVGFSSAAATMGSRANDNSGMSVVYSGGTAPGQWRPTPPGNLNAALPHWRYVTPWAVQSAQQFMAAPPPALNSPEYAAAFDEVRRLGSASSVERTAYQTDTAFLWRAAANTVTPPGQWFEVAQQLANTQNLSTEETSRMFALLGMAVADAGITAWETKNTYNFWRPITGINLADTDGNDLTTADPSWTPLFVTPNHQSYTSGHSTFSAAAATVLANFFGTDSMTFTVTGDNRSREYHSFSAAMQDAGMSRVYGGIHWQFDNQAGLLSGSQVGAWVYQNAFQVPAPSVAGVLGLGGLLAARRRR